ncbi:MAG: hypothetical protein ACYCV7_05470 [Acidimicrobiales bacterium]
MPGRDPYAADEDGGPRQPSGWQRIRSSFPQRNGNANPRSIGSRLGDAFLKAGSAGQNGSGAGASRSDGGPGTVPELEAAVRQADDKERLVGLLGAPIAALIGMVVSGSLIGNDPNARLSNGRLNNLHVNPTLYLELGGVAVGLAVVMLVTAMLRKRLYLGITMALYGLSIFNLHFWGFGLPYILAGAWLLVRAYRLQSKLKLAAEASGGTSAGRARAGGRTQPNKRYTPPASPPQRSPKRRPGDERKAG